VIRKWPCYRYETGLYFSRNFILLNIQKISHSLRKYRRWHRWLGLSLALLLLISSLTGIFLAWKKRVDLLQPPSREAVAQTSRQWLSVETISRRAKDALRAATGLTDISIDRIDVRPDKGIAKVRFEQAYWEVQLDGRNGDILSVAQRHSDWIEQIHDGSIISDGFKLISMNYLGLGLALLTVSGFWLWFGPKKIRQKKRKQRA
jgi:uncharacterized iron-regulated membrane protein